MNVPPQVIGCKLGFDFVGMGLFPLEVVQWTTIPTKFQVSHALANTNNSGINYIITLETKMQDYY